MNVKDNTSLPALSFMGGDRALTRTPAVGTPKREYAEQYVPGEESLEDGELRVTVLGSDARVAVATMGAIGGNDEGSACPKGAVVGAVARRNRNHAAAAFGKARAACRERRGYAVN